MSIRRRALPLLSLTLLALPLTVARAQFEGTISMHVAGDGGGGTDVDYSIKGDHVRMDVMTGAMALYMIGENGRMTMVVPARRMYMEQPAPSPAAQERAASKLSIKATGRTETIAGYTCEHYTITDADQVGYDACLTKELGNFLAPTNPMARGMSRGAVDASTDILARLGGGAFPLKVEKLGGGRTLEVTKIEKKPLSESMFTVPADFTKFDMGAMRGRPPE
jgi:hypothetical protein